MSKTCGDMARFNRIRKRNIARRMMVRQLREKLISAAAGAAKPGKGAHAAPADPEKA